MVGVLNLRPSGDLPPGQRSVADDDDDDHDDYNDHDDIDNDDNGDNHDNAHKVMNTDWTARGPRGQPSNGT